MKKQPTNPYLPSWEYIPDGEPYVFGDRLYIYGSHDKFGGEDFCVGDYAGWSAPLEDLSDWRYEGIIYKRERILFMMIQKTNGYLHRTASGDRTDGTICIMHLRGKA